MIKVLIVDDSALIRKILTDELSKYDDIEVVGSAVDPYVARDKIFQLKPDVITLDVEMPRMDGITFLSKLMKHFPIPVVIVSSLTPENSELSIKALEIGAVEVLCKPSSPYSTPDISRQLVNAIRSAASAKLKKNPQTIEIQKIEKQPILSQYKTTKKVLAIGASTGGTIALEKVLKHLPSNISGIVIVQHMPEHFTLSFAKRLNDICHMEVREAKDGDNVVTGLALLAPGNKHMILQKSGANFFVKIIDGDPVHYQRPSVDVLFDSVSENAGKNAIGAILTGMGADGAKGLLKMHNRGAYTIAQDEESCVVFGMPKEAIKLGACDEILPLSQIPQRLIELSES